MYTSPPYSTAYEGCISNNFFRHSLDDSQTFYLTQLSLNDIKLFSFIIYRLVSSVPNASLFPQCELPINLMNRELPITH